MRVPARVGRGRADRRGRAAGRGCWTAASWTRPDGIRVTRVLSLPAAASVAGPDGVPGRADAQTPSTPVSPVCYRCFTRLTRLGMSTAEIAAAANLPAAPAPAQPAARCRDAGACRRCETRCCASRTPRQFRLRRPPMSLEQFLADPRVRPLPPLPACRWRRAPARPTARAATATPTTSGGGARWPPTPSWIEQSVAGPGIGRGRARAGEPAGAAGAGGRRGAVRRSAARPGRGEDHRCGTAGARATGCAASRSPRSRLRPSRDHPQQAVRGRCWPRWPDTSGGRWPTPASEQAKDTWDLAVFGHRGTCRSPESASPGWPSPSNGGQQNNCPRHRGRGAAQSPRQDQRAAAAVGVPRPPTRSWTRSRRRWAAATSRTSSTGWPTWSRSARSAATGATASAVTCARCWPASAPWA